MQSDLDTVSILDIGTAVPPYSCTSQQTVNVARQAFANDPATLAFIERVVAGSGIDCRNTVVADYSLPAEQRTFFAPTPDLRPEPTTEKRNQLFQREANRLAVAACRSLSAKDWIPHVTHLLTASCTGFSAPGFDVALVRGLGLSPHVERTHVGFMGCYAAFSTLKLARHICASVPTALVLIVHVELCSIHVRLSPEPDTIVANCLFADGAAAALVGSRAHHDLDSGPSLGLVSSGSALITEGESDMTWTVADNGFRMTLSARVPHLLSKNLPAVFESFLRKTRTSRDSIRYWAVHPGGAAILAHVEKALHLAPDDLSMARALLRSHGNMSSATLWFLLKELRKQPRPGLVYACGFGPGLTAESAILTHPGS